MDTPRHLSLALLLVTLGPAGAALAQSQRVFFADFNSGAPSELSGVTTLDSVQGFAGVGHPGNQFSGNLLHNATGGNLAGSWTPGSPTRLTLTGLPQHTGVDLSFLLAVINTWDGMTDHLRIRLDGRAIFDETFDLGSSQRQTYQPPAGVLLTPRTGGPDSHFPDRGFGSSYGDGGYDMSLDPRFDDIPHAASTLTLEIWAGGPGDTGVGWEGGTNESWGIDNLEVVLKGVPEPTGVAPLALPSALALRRRRRA